MRAPALLIVLFASALAIEDFEREALGAPGPTRANLRGRGLKFGHSVTEVEEEATDPPAPAPTFAATDPPAPAPTAPAGDDHANFADSLDCAADCSDCSVVDPSMDWVPDGYDFLDYSKCVCYVGPMKADDTTPRFVGTYYDDCIAITEWTNLGDYSTTVTIYGDSGDDVIVAAAARQDVETMISGGGGTDVCTGAVSMYMPTRH